MFGLGNDKRIEGKVEALNRRFDRLIGIVAEQKMIINSPSDAHQSFEKDTCKCAINTETAEKCFDCRVKTGVTVEERKGFAGKTITTFFIPAKEAIEKIMDHLGIEFDHIDEKPSETVIKKKEV